MTLLYSQVDSPLGPLVLTGDGETLHGVRFPDGDGAVTLCPQWRHDGRAFLEARRQLAAYFHGELRTFDLAVHLAGTPFQRAVWMALADIPFAETRTYAEIARAVGRPKASRAVGAANGANPLPILFPCHRVIGADGSLTGFGGGLRAKEAVLRHEAQTLRPTATQLAML